MMTGGTPNTDQTNYPGEIVLITEIKSTINTDGIIHPSGGIRQLSHKRADIHSILAIVRAKQGHVEKCDRIEISPKLNAKH